ncbi:MAG: methyltransferase domain-containing protein [Aphanothece sp. CMT-3BRIN-NPC111]|nr:methyltransferase domain-containing protein [Aphanothece sp. CMT-3BRIN-NPC111]
MENNSMLENRWDNALYESKHAFVWQYGEELLQLLSVQPGERILDLGCGTGQLTQKIALAGAEVMGIDQAPTMIEKAKANYPDIQFAVADAKSFQVDEPFDAIFSNAVLHWITEPDAVISCMREALKPKGRFVAEFGGQGNIKAIASALYSVLEASGYASPEKMSPWYFPSIGEYATRLEQQGFDVTYAVLFDRPTPLEDGDAGMANWISMFGSRFLSALSADEQTRVIQAIEHRLKPTLYRDGTWIADYRRIRLVAIKA